MTYKEVLQRLADRWSDEFFNNSTVEHAAVAIEMLFGVAKGKVRVLTDHFYPPVYDRPEIRRAVERFLSIGGNELRALIVCDQVSEGALQLNPFINFLRRQPNVCLRLSASSSIKHDRHFMVVETAKGLAMRMEMDKEEHTATGSFNVYRSGELLCQLFDMNDVLALTRPI